ncbi:MAG: FadR family transcriptional regulator [Candidatus Dormibacteraeota bacterium]|uniref:FadR family transcriptional regulator n=1 Tax=Candidatus Aeolococcus gillhamiae TaxID=3127015 RepID=A0A934JTQ3_9BACT|nr:FadR family transcriptional regulator [Candidatus Dormibacteraeota bacterium]
MPIRNAGERIFERFVTAIALGEFVLAQRLPSERELAMALEVSRSTVREALSRLAAGGYIRIQRGSTGGAFVVADWGPESEEMIRRTLLSQWDAIESLLDFRSLVEQQVARTAADRRTRADARSIKRALRDYDVAGTDRDLSRVADLALHQAIACATQNPHLPELSLKLRREVSLGFGAEAYSTALRERALRQHPLLAEAVLEGRGDDAARLAAEHFSLTAERLRGLHERIQKKGTKR